MQQATFTEHGGEPNILDTTGLCLLSLDGGGVRGLSTLYILKSIMDRLNHETKKDPPLKPCEIFDLIGGTSTGGLIAIMLGRLEMSVDECIAAYSDLAADVFGGKLHRTPVNIKGEVKPRFDSARLESAIRKALTKIGASGTDLLNDGTDRGCHTFVCAIDRDTKDMIRLRSYSLPEEPSLPVTICEAALATSAITTFFDHVSIGDRTFAGGGFGANNPVDEVEGEAANIWCSETRDLKPLVKCFISIGTGNPGKKPFENSMLKFLSETVVQIATETEATESKFIARWAQHFDTKRYFRFNVEQGLQNIGLEEYKTKGDIQAASAEYLGYKARELQVRDCIENLRRKESMAALNIANLITGHKDQSPHSNLPPSSELIKLFKVKELEYEKFKDRNPAPVKNTCKWLENNTSYIEWTSQSSGILLITANSGCGKSVLAKWIVDKLRTKKRTRVCHFFFKDDAQIQTSSTKALCALLHQLFGEFSDLPESLKRRIANDKDNIFADLESLWSLLELVLENLLEFGSEDREEIVCVLDALDECEESGRKLLLKRLMEYFKDPPKLPKLKFFLTSRSYPAMLKELNMFRGKTKLIHIEDDDANKSLIREEIRLVTEDWVNELADNRELEEDEKDELLHCFQQDTISTTYLWVDFLYKELQNEENARLPKKEWLDLVRSFTIDSIYSRILSDTREPQESRALLQIILAAREPLTWKAMEMALEVQRRPGCKSLDDLSLENAEREFGNRNRASVGFLVTRSNILGTNRDTGDDSFAVHRLQSIEVEDAVTTIAPFNGPLSVVPRDYTEEMNYILTRNISLIDATAMSVSLKQDTLGDLQGLLEVFVQDLEQEAIDHKISTSDVRGIKDLMEDMSKLEGHARSYWSLGKPTWYYYHLVPGKDSCLKAAILDTELEHNSRFEAFYTFVCSSSAFVNLKTAIAQYCKKGITIPGLLSMKQYIRRTILQQPSHPCRGLTRIWYTCSCGQTIYDDYAEAMSDGAASMQKRFRMESVRQRYFQSRPSRPPTRSLLQSFREMFTSSKSADVRKNRDSLPLHHGQHSHVANRTQNLSRKHTRTENEGPPHVHWCIPHTRYATCMYPLPTRQLASDRAFFNALKSYYHSTKPPAISFFSFRKPTALRFVKFNLYARNLIDIIAIGVIPPGPLQDEYEYYPRPADTIPPVGPNILVHYFNHPEHATEKLVLLPCIPKRKGKVLEPCPVSGRSIGWGIDVVSGTDELKVFVWGLVACLLSMAFGIGWAVSKQDIQGGFGVASFIFAFLVFAIASLKAIADS